MGARITSIEYHLPEDILANEDLAKLFPDFSPEKISKKIGINARHIAADMETALDLGRKAAEKVLKNYNKEKIDFLLFCTQSPDYILPTSACILQEQLGLRKNIGALDYNLGCSGYIYGLALAKGLIVSGVAKTVLLIAAETYTKHLKPSDKGNRSIFGDGAAATIIENSDSDGIFDFALGTDGSGMENLIVRNGALRSRKNGSDDDFLFMNGPEIFSFTIEVVPELVNDVLAKNNLKKDEIDYFVCHQANEYMLTYLRTLLEVPEEKFYINLAETGNTVSATIPIALAQLNRSGKIKKGDKLLLLGFGVGYSCGAAIIEV